MTVVVEEKRYGGPTPDAGKVVYDLSYRYRYLGQANKFYNPFYTHFPDHLGEESLGYGSKGELIVKNTLSERLVEFLLMSFVEMAPLTGFTQPEDYKIHVLHMIGLIWD